MLPTDLKTLRDRVLIAEARMLEVRRNPARHAELTDQQKAVKAARAELAAYEKTYASG